VRQIGDAALMRYALSERYLLPLQEG
jgi:hypothetical protein